MLKTSLSIKVSFLAVVLVLPSLAGCGGSGGGVEPKAASTGPEPARVQRGVQSSGGEGSSLGN